MRARRILMVASLLAAGLALSGCESFDPESWFSPKKPLPGERRPMFPGGVPGVPQGVPPDLVKGYQAPPDNPPEVVTAEPEKPKPKPKPVHRQAAAPPRPAANPAPDAAQSAAPPQAAPWPSQQQ
jgi:hypothetical protein